VNPTAFSGVLVAFSKVFSAAGADGEDFYFLLFTNFK